MKARADAFYINVLRGSMRRTLFHSFFMNASLPRASFLVHTDTLFDGHLKFAQPCSPSTNSLVASRRRGRRRGSVTHIVLDRDFTLVPPEEVDPHLALVLVSAGELHALLALARACAAINPSVSHLVQDCKQDGL